MNPAEYWRARPLRVKAWTLVLIHLMCAIAVMMLYGLVQFRKPLAEFSWMNGVVYVALLVGGAVQSNLLVGFITKDVRQCIICSSCGTVCDVVWNYSIFDLLLQYPNCCSLSLVAGYTCFTISAVVFQVYQWYIVGTFLGSIERPQERVELGDVDANANSTPSRSQERIEPRDANPTVEIDRANRGNIGSYHYAFWENNSNDGELNSSPPDYKDIDLPPPYPGNPISTTDQVNSSVTLSPV